MTHETWRNIAHKNQIGPTSPFQSSVVMAEGPLCIEELDTAAQLGVLNYLKRSMYYEYSRIRSFRRCPKLKKHAYKFARECLFFLCDSWDDDSDFIVVCAYRWLAIALDCTSLTLGEEGEGGSAESREPMLDFEDIREHHQLKSPNCSYLQCAEPYRSLEHRFLTRMPYVDVYMNDFCPKSDIEVLEQYGNDHEPMSAMQIAEVNVKILCMKCNVRKVQVVFLPCNCSVLCATCGVDQEVCPGCSKVIDAYTRIILS
jgi:hypothetical protein